MLYLLLGHEGTVGLSARKSARPAHLDYLRGLQVTGSLVTAGARPKVEANSAVEGGFFGGLIIAEFVSLAAARAWAEQDPYFLSGVYERVDVQPYVQVLPA